MRDNEFRSCAIFGVHAKEGPHYHELIENNVFWNPRGLQQRRPAVHDLRQPVR